MFQQNLKMKHKNTLMAFGTFDLASFLKALHLEVGSEGLESVALTSPITPRPAFTNDKNETVEQVCRQWLDAYLRKESTPFNPEYFAPNQSSVSAFRLAVWDIVSQIPFGDVLSYADVARAIGQPLAARAVGSAVGQNPCFIFRPCHRVVTTAGTLGGFAFNLNIKQTLLAHEGLVFK